jgi:hypothetical protein
MAFGQSSGPPASAKQVAYLLSLVREAGHEGFRDARHPLGLTQRQAGGKFTSKEASELIDRLVNGEIEAGPPSIDADPEPTLLQLGAIAGIPARILADELVRRGWIVTPPPD